MSTDGIQGAGHPYTDHTSRTGGAGFDAIDRSGLPRAGTRPAGVSEPPPPPAGGDGDGLGRRLGLPAPKFSGADLMVLMQMLQTKTEDTSLQTCSKDVERIQKEKEAAAKKRMEELDKNIEKMRKADKAGVFGKIFGWIAAAAMAIAGAALMIAGGSGTALLVGGIAMMTVMTLQETGAMDKILEGIAEGLEKAGLSSEAARIVATVIVGTIIVAASVGAGAAAGPATGVALGAQFATLLTSPENLQKMGVSEKDAPWVSLGIGIGMALLSIGAGVGSAVKGTASAAGNVAERITQMGTKLAQKFADLSGKTLQQVQRAARLLNSVAGGIQAVATVGGGASGIATAVEGKAASDASAEVKESEKLLAKLQYVFKDNTDRMQEIMQRIEESTSIVMDVLNREDTATKRIFTV